MKKLILFILMTMSLYADANDDLAVITDEMIKCYNKDTEKGLLIFGRADSASKETIAAVGEYLMQDCPYENQIINLTIDKYTSKGQAVMMAKSCAVMLRNISSNLQYKAKKFDELVDRLINSAN